MSSDGEAYEEERAKVAEAKRDRDSRVRGALISFELLTSLLQGTRRGHKSDLPDDAEIIGVSHEWYSNAAVVFIRSKEFPRLEPGQAAPNDLHIMVTVFDDEEERHG